MARKKKTIKKTKKTESQKQRTKRNAILAAGALGVIVLGGAGGVGVREVDLRAREVLNLSEHRVMFAWPAIESETDGAQTWLPPSEQARLERLALNALGGGAVLDDAPLREAGLELARTGWFVGRPTLRRGAGGLVLIDGDWRIPAGVVRVGNRERLIAWDGVPLPLEYDAGTSGVRYLSHPTTTVAPAIGLGDTHRAWAGEDIREGLALLDLLDDEPGVIAQVAGIDLGLGGSLVIETDTGSRVHWGAGPSQFRPGEQSTEIKLNRIKALLERTGRIDGGVRSVQIDGPQILLGSN